MITDEALRARWSILDRKTTWRLRLREHDPLPCVIVGGHLRYDLEEIDAWLARQPRGRFGEADGRHQNQGAASPKKRKKTRARRKAGAR